MDMRQLSCFASVARAGSYSKAADELFITRQALSKTVAKLEEETGMTLFSSYEHGVRLTEQGASFLEEITPLLASYNRLERKYVSPVRKDTMGIAVSQGAFHPFPENFIPRFIENEADLDVRIEEIHSDGTLAMVASGDAEIGLLGTHPKYVTGFETIELAHPGFYISVPVDHPLANKRCLGLADLDDVPFVTLGDHNHLHRFFIEQCARVGVSPRIIVATSDMSVFEHFRTKESALAFACAPEYTQPFDDVVYIRLDMADSDKFGTYAIRRRDVAPSPHARRFWDYMIGYREDHMDLLRSWESGR